MSESATPPARAVSSLKYLYDVAAYKLRQKLLRSGQTILDLHSIRTLNGASVAIAATHITNFSRKIPEANDRTMVVAVKIVIGKETQHVGYGQALRTHAFALVAHAAVIGPDLLIQ